MTLEQSKVCDALCTYFKIPRAEIRKIAENYTEAAGADHPVISLDLTSFCGEVFNVGSSKSDIRLSSLLDFSQFERSELFSDVINLFSNEDIQFVVFVINKKGIKGTSPTTMVIHEAREYDGFGGIFVRPVTNYSSSGYVIETIKNYLKYKYPADEC
jgi:hypothetical protein